MFGSRLEKLPWRLGRTTWLALKMAIYISCVCLYCTKNILNAMLIYSLVTLKLGTEIIYALLRHVKFDIILF